MEAYPYKQMSEKKFFPNVAPSPGSGPLLLAGAVAVQGVGGRGWRLPIGRELKIEASHWLRGPQEKDLRLSDLDSKISLILPSFDHPNVGTKLERLRKSLSGDVSLKRQHLIESF